MKNKNNSLETLGDLIRTLKELKDPKAKIISNSSTTGHVKPLDYSSDLILRLALDIKLSPSKKRVK